MRKILVAALLIFFLNTCLSLTTDTSDPQIKEDKTSPEILADCFLSFNLSAWNDLDADGVWDESEPPLEGVEFQINGLFAQIVSEHPCISDEEGKCSIATWAPGECMAGDFTITATIPEGYKATIPTQITLSLASEDYAAEVQFGFTNR